MKESNFADKFVVISSIVFTLLFIGFFIWFPTIEFEGPGPTRAMSEGIAFLFFYSILFFISIFLLIKTLALKIHITKRWIEYFVFLPIVLVIGIPLFAFLIEGLEPSVDQQCHKIIFELKSSELLQNGQREFYTSKGSSGDSLSKPRKEKDSYIYDISVLTFKERERKLVIEADNCNASFYFDIPEMPKPQPFSKWKAPEKFSTSQPYVKLLLRYKVIKN